VALLLLRLVLGWTFIFHGSQKVFGAFGGKSIHEFAEGLSHMGLPAFLSPTAWAYIAAYGELIGGICVFAGLLARLGTIPIIASMIVAIMKVHGPNGFGGFMDPESHQMKTGYEFNLLIIAACAVVLIAGPGLISLDALLFRRGLWARGPQPLGEPTRKG
jgi:putative oxidoreductase